MRFEPIVQTSEPVQIRIRIPGQLQEHYRRVAAEKGLDVSDLYAQALAYAAGSDPVASEVKIRRKRSKI